MARPVVLSDASPLIALSLIARLDLLHALLGQITITDVVQSEILAGGDRPGQAAIVKAIRNAEGDGWTPFIATPMHPAYPCAHCCIVSASLVAVRQAEISAGPTPKLSSSSPTVEGAVPTWNTIRDFVQEVAAARNYDGGHDRNSTEVGTAMRPRRHVEPLGA